MTIYTARLGLVPTSDITIIIIIISTNITPLCRLCPSGNAWKHNHECANDRHTRNHKKMLDHFIMIMIMSLVMTMSSLRYRFPLDNKNLYVYGYDYDYVYDRYVSSGYQALIKRVL